MPNFVAMVNYFELYGLPVSFRPPQDAVKKKYYELSREFHPDRYAQAGTGAIDEAMKMLATINEAYKILKSEDATVKYVLQLNGMLEEEEKYNLPPDFLMEMMELNEAVGEYELEPTDDNKKLAIDSWRESLDALDGELQEYIAAFENGTDPIQHLKAIKDCYFRKKYLLRIQERIAKFATP